jgi:hypothetical protein
MLIEFYGKNFGCFRDEFRLSMVAADIDPGNDRGIVEVRLDGHKEPLRLLRAAAIFGANASGKSTVLRAAGALGSMLTYSAFGGGWRGDDGSGGDLDAGLLAGTLEPFALGNASETCELGVHAAIDGKVYHYQVAATTKRVEEEQLQQVGIDGEGTVLFHRHGKQVTGQWRDQEGGNFSVICKDFRGDALLLSLAAAMAPMQARKIWHGLCCALGVSMAAELRPSGFQPRITDQTLRQRLHKDDEFRRWTEDRLRAADTGVTHIEVRESKRRIVLPSRRAEEPTLASLPRYSISLRHAGDGVECELPFHLESDGTRAMLRLAPVVYGLTHPTPSTATFFIDEIHESLHPALLRAIISHFNCDTPKKRVYGQLIFATHETSLLDGEAKDNILRRDQVYFTKKLADGAATLYSLVEFKERNNLNLRKRYLEGRYGALPNVDQLGKPQAGGNR